MARKKKTDQEQKKPVKLNPYGWQACRNKAKFTKAK